MLHVIEYFAKSLKVIRNDITVIPWYFGLPRVIFPLRNGCMFMMFFYIK